MKRSASCRNDSKVQLSLPFACYGAILAGVDHVLVGAGSPAELPGLLDRLAGHEPVALSVRVQGATSANGDFAVTFDPRVLFGTVLPPLRRPRFDAIVASVDLARGAGGRPGHPPRRVRGRGPPGRRLLERAATGQVRVRTDGRASPTGFPFKVADLPGTLSDARVYADRPRICDLRVLRSAYRKPDGSIGYRSPAEPVAMYVQRRGGRQANTVGRRCLCNALLATAGLPQ